MSSPIYSNDVLTDNADTKIQKYIIPLLLQDSVDNINEKIMFVKHGVYIFIQYKEERYIINSFAEDVFWNMVNALYKLVHDCDNGMLDVFLQVVEANGMQALKMFEVTDNLEKEKLNEATDFIKKIKEMRIVHYHNMSPDDQLDTYLKGRVQKALQKISNNNAGPQSEGDWERCIKWICRNCENIYSLLEKRLDFFETDATKEQRKKMLHKYYESIGNYCDKIMYKVIKSILRKKRGEKNNFYIQSLINEKSEIIKEKAKELIKNSDYKVEPYHAIFEAADTIMNQKGREK